MLISVSRARNEQSPLAQRSIIIIVVVVVTMIMVYGVGGLGGLGVLGVLNLGVEGSGV